MASLQKLSCKAFLQSSVVGVEIPFRSIPGTLVSWIDACADCAGCLTDVAVSHFVKECIENGTSTSTATDEHFRENVRRLALTIGLCIDTRGSKRKFESHPAVMKLKRAPAWSWTVQDFAKLSARHTQLRVLKRSENVNFLTDLAVFYHNFEVITLAIVACPDVYWCKPWRTSGCCSKCYQTKDLVHRIPWTMYDRCLQRLVSTGLVHEDFGVGIYLHQMHVISRARRARI